MVIEEMAILNGNVITACISSNTIFTLIPANLKGSIISHINGYRTQTSNAKGHEITNSLSHKSNFVIIFPKNINKHKKKCQNNQISGILNFIKLSSII